MQPESLAELTNTPTPHEPLLTQEVAIRHRASTYNTLVVDVPDFTHDMRGKEGAAEVKDLKIFFYTLQLQLLWQPSRASISPPTLFSVLSHRNPLTGRHDNYWRTLQSFGILISCLFAWLPFVLCLLNFIPRAMHPSTYSEFGTLYGLLFTMSIALHQNLCVHYLRTGHLEDTIACLSKEDMDKIRTTTHMYMMLSLAIYSIPRLFWSPEKPYFTLLFQAAPAWLQGVNTIARMFGDLAVLSMCVVLAVVSSVLRRKIEIFRTRTTTYQILDIWDLIETHKADVDAGINSFSQYVEKWLVLHVIMFLLSVLYNALDVYLSVIGSTNTIPIVCVIKDLSLFIFVLIVPFLLLSSITRDCDALRLHLATSPKCDLPPLLHNRHHLALFLEYLTLGQSGFRLFGVRVTMSLTRYSWLLSVVSVGITAIHYSHLSTKHGDAS